MDEKDMKICKKKLEKEKSLTDGRRIEILFNECQHPKWGKANLFKGIISEIDKRMQAYENNIKEADNVAVRKFKDGESAELALQIKQYLMERLETCRKILNYVKHLKKVNRKLNNVNEDDRKKIKELLEKDLEKEEEAKMERELRDEL